MNKQESRFWEKVNRDGPVPKQFPSLGKCWLWTGSILKSGYGNLRFDGKVKRAHRVSYQINSGPIPVGYQVDHICRNHACVSPKHLRVATNKQNQENRIGWTRKRLPRGVTFRNGKFRARVIHQRHEFFVGVFGTAEDANAAVVAKRNELYTHNNTDHIGPTN